MAKVNIPTISSGFASTTALNNAFDTIETELNNKVLYRNPPVGEPNNLEADIDADSHTIYNLRDAVNVDEPVTLGQVQNIIAASSSGLIGSQRETAIATQGQTLFTFTGLSYYPGAGNLAIYLNGSKQAVGMSYVETSSTSITFTEGLNEGDFLEFITNESVANSVALASNVAYTPAGTGAVATDVQSKLRESVSVLDFGAVGDGVTDDSPAFNAALLAAKTYGKNVIAPIPPISYYLATTPIEQDGVSLDYNPSNISGPGIPQNSKFYDESEGHPYSQYKHAYSAFLEVPLLNAAPYRYWTITGAVNVPPGATIPPSTVGHDHLGVRGQARSQSNDNN
jgi:hypothetical protein